MNFLQLCQRTVQESGTISGDATPSTTAGQSGRLLKVVNWTATAWKDIQNLHDDWKWMRAEFGPAPVTAGNQRYTAQSWQINRFSLWITAKETVTLYATAIGPADERDIEFMPWEEFRRRYTRGVQVPGRPRHYSISPADEFCFGPIPDQAYMVKGEYQKNAQMLALDTDIPELPDPMLHTVIVWKSLLLLSQFDEGSWPSAIATVRCQDDLLSMKKYRPKVFVNYGGGASIA